MKGYLKRVVPLGLAVSVTLMGGTAMLSYRSIVDQVKNADWVTHSHIALERLETLRASLVKAEGARRGFVLTQENEFLEEFSAARAAIQKATGELRTLTADNASQQKRLDEIEPLLAERIRILERSIENLQSKQMSAGEQPSSSTASPASTRPIVAIVDEMESAERDLLQQRDAAAKASVELVKIILLGGTLVSFTILMGVFTILHREVGERERAQRGLEAAQISLEKRVRDRTSELAAANQSLEVELTERRRAEEEVRGLAANLEKRVAERTAALEETNKELEAFTYSVSHDLRAPLRHVDGFSRLLLEEHGEQLGPEGKRMLERVRQGIGHMGELVDDLLNLSRVSRREVNPLVTDLNTLVEEVLTELKPACQGRHVEFRAGRLPFAQCDPGLIRQVFANLLSNAVKFTRPRERAVIEVGQSQDDGRSAVFVRDNGVGFSMKYADKLFGVFQRLHRVEDFEGTGVGLATVQRIIQKHGGRVWVYAEIDKGATFYFTLEGMEDAHPVNTAVAEEVRSTKG
jgi:signal transduction histidine kinase